MSRGDRERNDRRMEAERIRRETELAASYMKQAAELSRGEALRLARKHVAKDMPPLV